MTSIGQNIRRLRKQAKWTQDELASQLNISSQAVSKWEMEITAPDLSQIIPLASLFGVSTDVLFGITQDGMEKEIAETKRICNLPETTNEQALKLWSDLYNCYPHNNHISFELATVHEYLASGDPPKEIFEQNYRDAAELYEKILDNSTDNELRSKTVYSLHHLYNRLQDLTNVLRISNMGGDWGTLKAEMLSKIDGYEDKKHWCQKIFRYYGEGAAWAIMGMDFTDDKTRIFAYETALKILDLVYYDGNHAWVSYVYIALYCDLAKLYAKTEQENALFTCLEKWYGEAVFEDNLSIGEYRYSENIFLDQIIYNHDLAFTHINRDRLLDWLDSNPAYDNVRSSEKFQAFIEKVRVMPGIKYPWKLND